jgi:hypothetical protein
VKQKAIENKKESTKKTNDVCIKIKASIYVIMYQIQKLGKYNVPGVNSRFQD